MGGGFGGLFAVTVATAAAASITIGTTTATATLAFDGGLEVLHECWNGSEGGKVPLFWVIRGLANNNYNAI